MMTDTEVICLVRLDCDERGFRKAGNVTGTFDQIKYSPSFLLGW